MADLDDNWNQTSDSLTDVTFLMFYDEDMGSLNIHTIKVHNLPTNSLQGNRIHVRFKVKDWDCATQVKTARTQDLIWNENLSHKLKSKHLAHLQLQVTVEEDAGTSIGKALLSLEDMNITEKTLYTLPIAPSNDLSKLHKGQLRFSVHPSENAVSVRVIKAQNLPRVMREYMVLVRLQSSEDYEKQTSLQKSPSWNEDISFKGKHPQNATLVLQVIGIRTNDRQVLGEVRLHLSDVRQKEYGRFLPLQEPTVDSVNFSTNFTPQSEQSGTLVFCIHGLENLRIANSVEKTRQTRVSLNYFRSMEGPNICGNWTNSAKRFAENFRQLMEHFHTYYVYVQIKQMYDGQIVKKEKTSRSPLSQNVLFKGSPLSFPVNKDQRKATTFILSIKTQEKAYTLDKPVIGSAVIGPLSEGKWYKDLLHVKNKEVHHSLHLKMN